jgi:hypothetical protein
MPPRRYHRPAAPAVGGSADGITRVVAPEAAPTRALPPTLIRQKLCHPLSPLCRPERAVVPRVLALAPPGRTLPPPGGTSLSAVVGGMVEAVWKKDISGSKMTNWQEGIQFTYCLSSFLK